MAYSKTIYIQPTTLTDLTVTLTRNNEVVNTWTLSDFVLGSSDGTNYYLQGTINNYVRNDILTVSSTGYQTQTIDIWRMTTDNITLTPLEFSNIETNSIKYYCKDEVARNSIANITTDLSNKAGTDLANVTDSAKVMMSGMGMPSNRYIDLTLGASGAEYTAPANGWILVACTGTAGSTYMEITSNSHSACASYNGGWGRAMAPVLKGQTFNVYYGGKNFASRIFRFVYAQGSESEAN